MIGVVVVSHAHIAREMKRAVEHVLGEQTQMETLDVLSSDQVEQLEDELGEMIRRCNHGQGVLVFADMFGGTPCNLTLRFLESEHCEVVSGFNLPALIQAASRRKQPEISLSDLAGEVVASGQRYICRALDSVVKHPSPSVAVHA